VSLRDFITVPSEAVSSPEESRRWRLVLLALLAAAFALRLLTWWLLPNIHHGDEIFQYQEPAFRLIQGYGVATWEYIEGTSP
jgi:hypothetical protein